MDRDTMFLVVSGAAVLVSVVNIVHVWIKIRQRVNGTR